jgi:hypothetical protein
VPATVGPAGMWPAWPERRRSVCVHQRGGRPERWLAGGCGSVQAQRVWRRWACRGGGRRAAGPAVEGGMVVVVKMKTKSDALLTRPAAWRGNTVKGFAWLGNHHPHPPKPQALSRPC